MIRILDIRTWTQLCVSLLLILGCCVSTGATNLTGTFKNPDGSAVNGKIIFLLSQPARLNDQSAQIVPMVKIFSVTNGALETGAFVFGNDVLVPGGTYYLVRLVDNNNNLLFEQKWSISGVNLDLGSLTPTTSGVVFPDPLIKNVSTDQSVQGPVSFSAPITAFSLTLNGNLNPGLPDSYELGSSTAPWQELHARRWNSLVAIGPSAGTALAPTAVPAATYSASGGSIPDGTYYFKITYVNRNGETTGSPAVTLVVTGGSGNARVNVSSSDTNWQTGCYGVRIYASNDNVNFYLQTPTPIVADFMTDTWTHYVTMGSGVRRLIGSLTFSGTQIPITNTATIDPLQVALNATRRALDGTPFGTLMVSALNVSPYGHQLTTPLITVKTDRVIGSSSMSGLVNQQSRIITSTAWNDNKLAVVMMFGGDANISNVGIQGQGTNALMVLGGASNQAGNFGGTSVSNAVLRVSDATNTYSAFVGVGILYDIYFTNVSMTGGNALIQYRNAAGGLHYYTGGRWDVQGDSFVRNISGYTDPDNGANDAGFANGLGTVVVKNIRTEGGKGIIWDAVGVNLTLDTVEVADLLTQAGTAALLKMGTDATIPQAAGTALTIINCAPGSSANAAVGIKVNVGLGNQSSIQLVGNSVPPVGANNIGVDASNIQLFLNNLTTTSFTANPNASGGAIRMINVPDNSRITGGGGGSGQLADGGQWFEIPDRLVLVPHIGNNAWGRAGRTSFENNNSTTALYKSDDTTYLWQVTHSNGNLDLRGNLRVQATGGVAASLFIGPSASTATGGSIGLVNQGSVYMRNAAGSADVRMIAGDPSDRAIVGDTAGVCLSTSTNCAPIKGNLSSTATLDFPNTAVSACSDLTMTVTGAVAGDPVFLGVPNASVPPGGSFFAWVSGANTVTVRFCADGTARDPASGVFRASVIKF